VRQLRQCGRIDIADADPGTFADEGPRDRQPDAAGAGTDHHTQSTKFQVHSFPRLRHRVAARCRQVQ
jgi:hypothetical protein